MAREVGLVMDSEDFEQQVQMAQPSSKAEEQAVALACWYQSYQYSVDSNRL
jgi:hypothetical protein